MKKGDRTPKARLRPMCDQDLTLVLTWRNHPEVRRYMFSTHEIDIEEHRRWFEQAMHESVRHLLIYEQEDLPLGFVNLHVVNPVAGFADWGFYVSPEAPRGTGTFLGEAVAKHVFCVLGLYKLSGQVLKFNERSLRFHLRLGFKQEGVLRKHHFDGTDYHDLVCFGLLRNEWTNSYG